MSAEQGTTKEEIKKDTVKKEGKKKQPGDPAGYNPGGERVIVSAKAIKRVAAYGSLWMDDEIIGNLTHAMTSATYPTHTVVERVALTRPDWQSLLVRVNHLLCFKQLGGSVRADYQYLSDHWGKQLTRKILAPAGMLPIIRQFGTIEGEGGDWEIKGQPILASTSLLRAIGHDVETYSGVNQNLDRFRSYGLDLGMPNVWQFLVEFCAAQFNQWACGRTLIIRNGAFDCRVLGPTLIDGFETFIAAFQHNNFPQRVLRALRIGLLAEGVLRNNPQVGPNLAAGVVNALNAEDVVVFYWRRDDYELRFTEYYDQVQHRVLPTLDTVFAMAEVGAMGPKGGLSQLVTREDTENAFCAEKIPGDMLEMGVMLAATGTGNKQENMVYRVDVDSGPIDMVVKWFEGMKRGKKKQGQ